MNCREMEANVLPSPEVRRELLKMIPTELYTDDGTVEAPKNQKLELKYASTTANPVYAVISPDEKVLGIFEGRTDSVTFAKFLQSSRANGPQVANR